MVLTVNRDEKCYYSFTAYDYFIMNFFATMVSLFKIFLVLINKTPYYEKNDPSLYIRPWKGRRRDHAGKGVKGIAGIQ